MTAWRVEENAITEDNEATVETVEEREATTVPTEDVAEGMNEAEDAAENTERVSGKYMPYTVIVLGV